MNDDQTQDDAMTQDAGGADENMTNQGGDQPAADMGGMDQGMGGDAPAADGGDTWTPPAPEATEAPAEGGEAEAEGEESTDQPAM